MVRRGHESLLQPGDLEAIPAQGSARPTGGGMGQLLASPDRGRADGAGCIGVARAHGSYTDVTDRSLGALRNHLLPPLAVGWLAKLTPHPGLPREPELGSADAPP